MVNMDISISFPEEDEQFDKDGEDREVEKVLYALSKEAITNGRASSPVNGNRHANLKPTNEPKSDMEIPRKNLYASIGSLSLFIIVSFTYPVCLAQVFSRYSYIFLTNLLFYRLIGEGGNWDRRNRLNTQACTSSPSANSSTVASCCSMLLARSQPQNCLIITSSSV